ncbi:phosphoribosyl 1,2-cyclic phosphodiesterase [Iodidimonas nitroreducens]|uniref:Phosphoribosyl 1,2-cyclic phosphodiesterase n=1 Tax=Iodidimonas nitroreducens TaxID=1236968 RepID=A0A5A7N7C5_9PROT|nr:MBL fold metallo-hydrolase [Iodidimonas nitroreducens]GAK32833.1 octanoyltransferase [alpha proteobacterium Q-1]GER02979.1 phosphoribosyl 1,2-cyclic phosphodiesterase [Iodidimonas nitroreducens]
MGQGTDSMQITILGCGTSTGVPRLPNDWGRCDPAQPKNRRTRASILIQQGDINLLIDCGPDMRAQLLATGIDHIDAVLITHDHADHTHGIDDLRGFHMEQGAEIPLFAPKETLDRLYQRFDYIFSSRHGYPAICKGHEIAGPIRIGGLCAQPFWQEHGPIWSLGFRFGDFAYSTDVNAFPKESLDLLRGIKLWVVDALRHRPHRTHSHLDKTLGWIDEVKPERAILTHLSNDMDYDSLRRSLPPHIEPAYDGMVLRLMAEAAA